VEEDGWVERNVWDMVDLAELGFLETEELLKVWRRF
jgi:hypothetical protein